LEGEAILLKDFFSRKKNNTTIPDEIEKKAVPEGLMEKCISCKEIYYYKDWEKNLRVCPECGHHHPLTAWERINATFDKGTFKQWDEEMKPNNPLSFPEYEEKVKKDQDKTGLNEAVVSGEGLIGGNRTAFCVMDSRFRMGSMGSVVGEKIARAVERAREMSIPFIIFTASGGARMQEGALSLMQMTKASMAIKRHSEAGGLFISVMTHPTTGGVSASFASLGDYNFAEPKALIGFAGRRIIEQTIREKLPKDFQTAEFLLKHGQLDQVVKRHDLRELLEQLLALHKEVDNK